METTNVSEQQTQVAVSKPITMRDRATDELMKKVNQLTEPIQIEIVNRLLNKTLGELSYLDSTFLRDILKLDLNLLALNFGKGL